MPCTPDYCDTHDYPVAPGGGWCRAVDTAYYRAIPAQKPNARNEDLTEAMGRLGDILERMEARQTAWTPTTSAPDRRQPKQNRTGGTPL